MDPEVLARKRIVFTSRQRAVLGGYALRFNKRNGREALPPQIGFANIEPMTGEVVEGVLYDIPDEQSQRLDAIERHPEHYDRVAVTVNGRARRITFGNRAQGTGDVTGNFNRCLSVHF